MKLLVLLWTGTTIALVGPAAAQTIVKQEPPVGGMRRGEVLWVDNGKCPKGQIMQVTAGTMGASGGRGSGGQAVGRDRKCVPRR
jgi:hypothetical protein